MACCSAYSLPQLAFRLLAAGDVPAHDGRPADAARAVLQRRNGHRQIEPPPLLGHADRFQVVYPLALAKTLHDLRLFAESFRRHEQRNRLSDDLLRPIAEEPLAPAFQVWIMPSTFLDSMRRRRIR